MTQLDYTFDRQIELEREEGRMEGLEQGESQIIKHMLSLGLSDEEIKKLTGCKQDVIDKLRN